MGPGLPACTPAMQLILKLCSLSSNIYKCGAVTCMANSILPKQPRSPHVKDCRKARRFHRLIPGHVTSAARGGLRGSRWRYVGAVAERGGGLSSVDLGLWSMTLRPGNSSPESSVEHLNYNMEISLLPCFYKVMTKKRNFLFNHKPKPSPML